MKKFLLFAGLLTSITCFAQPEKLREFKGAVHSFASVGEKLFFVFDSIPGNPKVYLFTSDGTPEGTDSVRSISSTVYYGATDGSYYYFNTYPNQNDVIWKSDGTRQGTTPLDTFMYNNDQILVRLKDKVFFIGGDSEHGQELYVLQDGQLSLVKDINPGPENSANINKPMRAVGNYLFFYVNELNAALWFSDGTGAGTQQVSDVNSALAESENIFDYNGKILFTRQNGNSLEVRLSPDPSSTSVLLKSFTDSVSISYATAVGTTAYFDVTYLTKDGSIGYFELWKTDGTVSGTQLVSTFPQGQRISSMIAVANQLAVLTQECGEYSSVDIGVTCTNPASSRLWKSDGSAAGTQEVKLINSGESYSAPVAVLGNKLYIDDSSIIWQTDLTSEGTFMLSTRYPEFNGLAGTVSVMNDTLYLATTNNTGSESTLWKLQPSLTTSIYSAAPGINKGIAFYPTPVISEGEINLPEDYTGRLNLVISDLTGRVIYEEVLYSTQGKAKVNLSGLEQTGLFTYSVLAKENIYQGKILKK